MDVRGFWASERNLSVLAIVIATAVFLVEPLAPRDGLGVVVLVSAYVAILISGIAAVARTRGARIAVSAVALASAVIYLAAIFAPGAWTSLGRAISAAAFLLLLSGIVFARILREGTITIHRVSGAVAAYLLIGLVFSYVFEAIELQRPGSFLGMHPSTGLESPENRMSYFSFTTLATLGYGDIVPVHPLARSLANLEALIGQLFPAILIARLVALELESGRHGSSPDR